MAADAKAEGNEDVVMVQFRVPSPLNVSLSFEYLVVGASWRPSYNLRASVAAGTVGLEYNAVISQRSPESWDGCRIDLSTAHPHVGASPPTIQPWKLARYVPQNEGNQYGRGGIKMSMREAARPSGAMVYAAEDSGVEFAEMYQSVIQQATVTTGSGGSSVASYAVPGSHTVLPGEDQLVAIAHIDLDGKFDYRTVPSLQTTAFLRCTLKNTSPFIMLSGPANVYDDTGFVATTNIPNVLTSETFVVFLGVDDGIGVKYTQMKRARSDRGGFLTSKTVTWDIGYEIVLRNRKEVEVTLAISDKVPVSSEEGVVVEVLEPQGLELGKREGDAFLSNEGILEITRTLAPGEIVTINLRYTITHPADITLQNLF
jgi:uncharacterized protein (TIGR02231 family)